MTLAYEAMQFARKVHATQRRKYTNAPYADHLAEVAGIVSTVAAYAKEAVAVDEILATRKRLSRERLAAAPGWVQTIKCADLISNTSSIVQYDPAFAKVYLEEKRLLLEVMGKADPRLWAIASELSQGEA